MFGRFEEILVVVALALLLFGSKRIPELFRNLGKSVNEFKKGMSDSEPSSPDKEKTERKDPPKLS